MQIVSMLEVTLDIQFPGKMSSASRAYSLFNMNFVAIAPVGCVAHVNQDMKMLLYTSSLIALGLLVYANRQNAGFLQGYLILVSFLLPTITKLIFSTFPCLELDTGDSWLLADKSIDCTGDLHVLVIFYAWAMAIIFCIGVPGGCYFLLWKSRARIRAEANSGAVDKKLDRIR